MRSGSEPPISLGETTSLPDGIEAGVRKEIFSAADLSFRWRSSTAFRASAGSLSTSVSAAEESAGVNTKTTQSKAASTIDVVTWTSGGAADDDVIFAGESVFFSTTTTCEWGRGG